MQSFTKTVFPGNPTHEVTKQTTEANSLTTAPKVMSAVTFIPKLVRTEYSDNILKILYL